MKISGKIDYEMLILSIKNNLYSSLMFFASSSVKSIFTELPLQQWYSLLNVNISLSGCE